MTKIMFIESIDRVMISSLFLMAPQIIKTLGRYKVSSLFNLNPNIELYVMPDSYLVMSILDGIDESFVDFIDKKYEYFIINRSTYEVFCINKRLKLYLDNFRTPKTDIEVKKINTYFNCDYFDHLMLHGFIMKSKQLGYYSRTNCSETILNRFQFHKKLASNFSSSTYLVRSNASSNKYILKIYQENDIETDCSMNNEIYAREIFKEYDFLPKIVEVDRDKNYILMEYVEGNSIRDYLNMHPKMSNRIKVATDIMKIVAAIHSKNYLHGDLHSGQFIIDKSDNIKLLDWEMLVNMRSHGIRENNIQGGVFEYLAPETIRNDPFYPLLNKKQSFYSEVYRLGVILYLIMYNEFPYIEFTWNQLYNAIKNEKLIFHNVNMFQQSVPSYIREIIIGCLQKQEHERFTSAAEISMMYFIK